MNLLKCIVLGLKVAEIMVGTGLLILGIGTSIGLGLAKIERKYGVLAAIIFLVLSVFLAIAVLATGMCVFGPK